MFPGQGTRPLKLVNEEPVYDTRVYDFRFKLHKGIVYVGMPQPRILTGQEVRILTCEHFDLSYSAIS